MDAPAVGAACRGGVPAAVRVFSLARLDRAGPSPAALDFVRRRCSPWRGRLVDGVVGPLRPGQRVAVPAGVPPDARLCDLCGDPLDRAGAAPTRAATRARP